MKRQYLFGLFLLMAVVMASCAPKATPSTQVSHPVTETPAPRPDGWPLYTLATQLPEAPAQVRLYQQALPAALPTGERLAALMNRLKITGEVKKSPPENGITMLSVFGGSDEMYLWSDDPLIMDIWSAKSAEDVMPAVILPINQRVEVAKAYLDARNLLDFPYIMEPPALSSGKDTAIRVVPLIDGIPLNDYYPRFGRLLVTFDKAGEISYVTWRSLKLVAGENVEIIPAAKAWQQFVNGETPKKTGVGRCWQASVYDSSLPYGTAGIIDKSAACVTWPDGIENTPLYTAAIITDVKLVYFTIDLSLGNSPFSFPSDSPARVVYPMWQFSGSTSDGRELLVLWPAMSEK